MKNLIRFGLNQKMNEQFLIEKNSQNHWSLYVNDKKYFFVRVYKMFNIAKETLQNNSIEVIVDSVDALWLNDKNIEEKLGYNKLPVITNKCDKIYKKSW